MTQQRALGWSIGLLALAQFALYGYRSVHPDSEASIYLDSRIGWFYFLEVFTHTNPVTTEWCLLAWPIIIATALIAGRSPLRTYLAIELMLSLPSLVFLLCMALLNIRPVHGVPNLRELVFLSMVFALYSAAPVTWAFTLLRRGSTRSSQTIRTA